MNRTYGVVTDGMHSPSIGRDDSSVSAVWRPFCTCGWSGIAVYASIQIDDLQGVFQKFVEQHGVSSILPIDAVLGNENDALIQVLIHLDYDPKEDERYSMSELDAAVEALKNFDEAFNGSDNRYDLTAALPSIADEVIAQKHRLFVWSNTAVPELRKNAAEMEIALRQHLIQSWESNQKTTE